MFSCAIPSQMGDALEHCQTANRVRYHFVAIGNGSASSTLIYKGNDVSPEQAWKYRKGDLPGPVKSLVKNS